MIKANELRVGNWLLTDEDEMLQVNEIKQDFNGYEYTITFITSDDMYHDSIISECNPIPLTEEILFKCGKLFDTDSTGIKWFSLDEKDVIQLLPDSRVLYCSSFVESLHELQNCFYWRDNRKVELNVEL